MATYKIYKKTSATEKEEIKIPYNVLSNPPDLSIYPKKADAETISGVWTFTGTPKMDTLENSKGNAMYHFNAERVFFGQTTFPITFRGSLARPQYTTDGTNFKDLALSEDVPEVVQATGTSTTSVMSQKATTDELAKKANSADLASVAESGSYNDLTGKPTIPTKTSQLTNDSGFTANIGTVTQVKVNGTTELPDSNGLVDLGTISGGASPTDVTITGGNGYILMPQGDSGKYTFIGTFDLGDTNQSFTMTIGNQTFSITLNEHDSADTMVYIELDIHYGSTQYNSSARLFVYIPGAEPAINKVYSIAATDDITLSFSLSSSYSLSGTEIRIV